MKKDLILVGNKPPMKPIGNLIDSFDFIIRINKMDYLGHSGNRIDGLYLEANHDFVINCNGGKQKEYLKNANQIFIRKHIYQTFSNWNSFITPIQFQRAEVIDELKIYKDLNSNKITSSILMTYFLLNSHWAEEYNIYLTCIDIENRAILIDNHPNWKWHSGAGIHEQRYLNSILSRRLITRIQDE